MLVFLQDFCLSLTRQPKKDQSVTVSEELKITTNIAVSHLD